MIRNCYKIVFTIVFAWIGINVSAQDLLARQAPIDRKLKAVDSVALLRQIKTEMAEYPAYNTRNFRLAITKAVKITLTNALTLLGIETVEEM